jgi:hypothetical protein
MRDKMTRVLAVLLSAVVAAQGCATMRAGTTPPLPARLAADQAMLADYVQRLPVGTAVTVDRTSGLRVRGTLMKATADSLVVQPRTRVPEPPVEIALADVLAVTPESRNGGSVGRAIAAGVAAGAGAALVTFFVLLAIFSD